jgi:uncharacterized protein with PIN domain
MNDPEPRFACDVMLGALARWLRAAGYDASWAPHIDDGDLVRLARDEGRLLLSSDGGIFQRTAVRQGQPAALFVPRGLDRQEQLAFVLGRLSLPLRPPRCMACGGALAEAARERVRDRVPLLSFARMERFYECARCARVFWHGTHWQRIAGLLRAASPAEEV